MPTSAEAATPPSTPMPMGRRASAPAPEAGAGGGTPGLKAKVVIRIGRSRIREAVTMASSEGVPFSRRSCANATLRIAFRAASPMVVSRPTLKRTSFHWPKTWAVAGAPGISTVAESIAAKCAAQLP